MTLAKKVSSIVFSVALAAGLLPYSAYAETSSSTSAATQKESVEQNSETGQGVTDPLAGSQSANNGTGTASSNDNSVAAADAASGKSDQAGNSESAIGSLKGDSAESSSATSSGKAATSKEAASAATLAAEVPDAAKESTFKVSYETHVQDIGWQEWANDGAMAGTSGQAKRLEAVKIKLGNSIDGGISYSTHIQDIGWQSERSNGELSGTEGQGKRLEAITISLTGNAAETYSVWYRVHAEDYGWLGWTKDGEKAGTQSLGKRLEAMEVVVLPKGEAPTGYDSSATAFKTVELSYSAHIQDFGTTSDTSDTLSSLVTLGTTGQSKRIEALSLKLGSSINGGISYNAHVQDVGWQGERADGAIAGTTGQSKRIEAITFSLTGNAAETYSIWYRVHAEDYGWMGWTKDGEKAGTQGLSKRLEAIELIILPKGQTPSSYDAGATAFRYNVLNYSSHIASEGTYSGATDSPESHVVLGSTGRGHSLEGFTLGLSNLATEVSGSISYRAHVSDVGWQDWVSDGAFAGTSGQAKQVQAAEFKLSGSLAEKYDIYYRAHVSNIGWMSWAKNGESAVGSTGCGIPIEAIEVALVLKGSSSAPSTSGIAYLDKSLFPSISCGSQSSGWGWGYGNAGDEVGTTGQGRPLVGVSMGVSSGKAISGGISYQMHFANVGWAGWTGDGAQAMAGDNAVQALEVSLTGDLGTYFDVYYRAHVSGYGWMGWAKNGAPAGTTGLDINVEAYQIQIVAKGAAAPGSTAQSFSDENGFLGMPADQRAMRNVIAYEGSSTEWLIGVDRSAHKVGVFHGSSGDWRLYYWWDCVTGADASPTITGSYYTTGYKRDCLDTDSRAIYCTQIWGGYFFHSVLNSESELGQSLSHGCIRMGWSAAAWIHDNIWSGTKVVIYN